MVKHGKLAATYWPCISGAESCVRIKSTIHLHSLAKSLLGLLELVAAESPVQAGEGAAIGVAVVPLPLNQQWK